MENVPKRARGDVEKLVYELMRYPKPARYLMLMEMDIIDIIMAAQVEQPLSQWMREQGIWRDLWIAKVIPRMIAKKYARDQEHALSMSLGDNQRQNCLVWYFACNRVTDRFRCDPVRMKSKTQGSSATVLIFVNKSEIPARVTFQILIGYGDLSVLKGLLPGSSIDMSSGRVILPIDDDIDQELKRARIFYALLSMGYHFIVTMRDESERTFYIRSKADDDGDDGYGLKPDTGVKSVMTGIVHVGMGGFTSVRLNDLDEYELLQIARKYVEIKGLKDWNVRKPHAWTDYKSGPHITLGKQYAKYAGQPVTVHLGSLYHFMDQSRWVAYHVKLDSDFLSCPYECHMSIAQQRI
jgi:hypothetical protein